VARKRSTPESVAARRELRGQLTDPAPVMEAAAAFLAVRQRSVSETTKRLAQQGYPSALVEDVVTRLIEMNYLDDELFARSWVESRDRARPRGEQGLRRELALKGVPRDIVDNVMAQREESAAGEDPDLAAAAALLSRKRHALEREPDTNKRRHKAYGLLARNGFDSDTCRQAINAEMGAW
jgi:regulatory protein